MSLGIYFVRFLASFKSLSQWVKAIDFEIALVTQNRIFLLFIGFISFLKSDDMKHSEYWLCLEFCMT